MVGGHEIDGVRPQEAHAALFAFVAQALQKAGVVHGRGHQATAAALQFRRLFGVQYFHQYAAIGVLCKGLGYAVVLIGWHHKAGVDHAQWPENFLLQKLPQRLPADDLDQAAQYVGGTAVGPHAAGLKLQGQCSEGFTIFGIRAIT
jgi:hypothetical protein